MFEGVIFGFFLALGLSLLWKRKKLFYFPEAAILILLGGICAILLTVVGFPKVHFQHGKLNILGTSSLPSRSVQQHVASIDYLRKCVERPFGKSVLEI